MATDLLTDLRLAADCNHSAGGDLLAGQAADEIEFLRSQLVHAERALGMIDTFAWSALSPDCPEAGEEVMRVIGECRRVLKLLRLKPNEGKW